MKITNYPRFKFIPGVEQRKFNIEESETLKSKIKSTGNPGRKKRDGDWGPGHGERQWRGPVGCNMRQWW